MLESLDYIYWAMYVLDISKSINAFCTVIMAFVPALWGSIWFITGLAALINESSSCFGILWEHTKIYQIISYIIFGIVIGLNILMPGQNTIKAYIGVKATQAVGNYLNDSTDVPAHCKKTINNLWNKVDKYIESINVDSTISATTENIITTNKDSTDALKSITNKATAAIGQENLDKIISAAKQAAADSIVAKIKKH